MDAAWSCTACRSDTHAHAASANAHMPAGQFTSPGREMNAGLALCAVVCIREPRSQPFLLELMPIMITDSKTIHANSNAGLTYTWIIC